MSRRTLSETQFGLGPEQLASLLDAVEELLLVVSSEGAVLYASPALTGLLGQAAEQLCGLPVSQIFLEEDRSVVERLLRESSYSPKARGRCRLRLTGGTQQWFDAVVRDRSMDPAIQGLLLILSDASAAHRMEAERQVIADVVHALNETSNLDQLLCRIHQALKRVLYAENCFVTLHRPETDFFSFP